MSSLLTPSLLARFVNASASYAASTSNFKFSCYSLAVIPIISRYFLFLVSNAVIYSLRSYTSAKYFPFKTETSWVFEVLRPILALDLKLFVLHINMGSSSSFSSISQSRRSLSPTYSFGTGIESAFASYCLKSISASSVSKKLMLVL